MYVKIKNCVFFQLFYLLVQFVWCHQIFTNVTEILYRQLVGKFVIVHCEVF